MPASEDPLLQSNFAPFIERLIASYTALLNRPAAPTANDRAISRLALTALRAICLGAASPLRRNDTPVIYGRVVSALMGVVWDAAHSSANARLFQGTVAAIGAEGAAGNFSEANSTLCAFLSPAPASMMVDWVIFFLFLLPLYKGVSADRRVLGVSPACSVCCALLPLAAACHPVPSSIAACSGTTRCGPCNTWPASPM